VQSLKRTHSHPSHPWNNISDVTTQTRRKDDICYVPFITTQARWTDYVHCGIIQALRRITRQRHRSVLAILHDWDIFRIEEHQASAVAIQLASIVDVRRLKQLSSTVTLGHRILLNMHRLQTSKYTMSLKNTLCLTKRQHQTHGI